MNSFNSILRISDPAFVYATSVNFKNKIEYGELSDKVYKFLDELFINEEYECRSGVTGSILSGRYESGWINGIRDTSPEGNGYLFIPRTSYEKQGIFHVAHLLPDGYNQENGRLRILIHRLSGDSELKESIEENIKGTFERAGFKESN